MGASEHQNTRQSDQNANQRAVPRTNPPPPSPAGVAEPATGELVTSPPVKSGRLSRARKEGDEGRNPLDGEAAVLAYTAWSGRGGLRHWLGEAVANRLFGEGGSSAFGAKGVDSSVEFADLIIELVVPVHDISRQGDPGRRARGSSTMCVSLGAVPLCRRRRNHIADGFALVAAALVGRSEDFMSVRWFLFAERP